MKRSGPQGASHQKSKVGRTLPVDLDTMSLVDIQVPERQLVELVQAITKCEAGDAEYALACTADGESATMAWCARAIVYLRRIGLPTNEPPRKLNRRVPPPEPETP